MPQPLFIIFAGPNCSGKSTLIAGYKEAGVLPKLYINADDMTRELLAQSNLTFQTAGLEELGKANILAADKADALRQKALMEGISFVTETVMSTSAKINTMREAKAKNYHVHLVFVTTEHSAINVDRVATRVKSGGHGVPEDKVISRHAKANQLMAEALQAADSATVYDNSGEKPVVILIKDKDREISLYPKDYS